MDNLNYWPYTDIHELNLDWILEKVKALDSKLNDDIDKYVQEYIDEHFEDWTVNANYDPETQTIVYTNGTGAQQTLGDVIKFAIDNVFVEIKDAIARADISDLADDVSDAQADITTLQENVTSINSSISSINTHINNVESAISINGLHIYEYLSNATSFTISNPPNIASDRFKYALVWGGTSAPNTFFHFVFIDGSGNATSRDILSASSRTITYNVSGTNFIVSANDTLYGGIRVLWLN